MRHTRLTFPSGFNVAIGNAKSQCAVMVLEPDQTEGGPDNRHRGADQWLLVIEGIGIATVAGVDIDLAAGTVVLIEAGEAHCIRNTGTGHLKTVNVYLPPAYDATGDELPAGEA